jgi:hypothetical protein
LLSQSAVKIAKESKHGNMLAKTGRGSVNLTIYDQTHQKAHAIQNIYDSTALASLPDERAL